MELDDSKIEKAFENEQNKYLLGFTSEKLNNMIRDLIGELELEREESQKIVQSLKNYKYVDEVSDLKYGTYLRWVPLNEKYRLNPGALFCEAKITDNGISLLCKSVYNKRNMFQLQLDENIIFQKLTNEELILLTALDYLSK